MNQRLLFFLLLFSHNVFSTGIAESRFTQTESGKLPVNPAGLDLPRQVPEKGKNCNLRAQNKGSVLLKSLKQAASVLNSGRWVKVVANESGMHRITFSSLKSMGFQSPQNLRIFGFPPGPLSQINSSPVSDDLTQIPVWKTTDKQSNDCLIIYIPETVNWIFDPKTGLFHPQTNQFARGRSVLYLTEDSGSGQNIQTAPSEIENTSVIVTEFDDFAQYEEENINLIQSGSQWFSALLSPNVSFTRTLKFPDHVSREPFRIAMAAAARCDSPSSLELTVNNSTTESVSFAPYSNFAEADYADLKEHIFTETIDADNLNFLFKYTANYNGLCWLDYIRVQTRRKLNMQPGQIRFCDTRSAGLGNVAEFRIANNGIGIKVWDITSPMQPVEMQCATNTGIYSFKARTESLRRFIAFDPSADFPGVDQPEVVDNQNLHGINVPDMLIVTAPEFRSQADRLANYHHQESGMEVATVNASQIYNEFSGGIADPTAIRNFVRFLYHQPSGTVRSKLKYLLLFGKGTYDNLHPVSALNPDYIPTWQSENSVNPVSSFVSDDYFGLLGDDEGGQSGIVDIGIGRIPCSDATQAKAAADKIIHYKTASTLGEWRNVICFVADDQDNNIHVSDSEQLANYVNLNHPSYATEKIYLDAFQETTTPVLSYPGVNKAIHDRVKAGALMINYVGHANEEEWAAEKVLTIGEIDSWSNIDKLPVFITATCEFSRWDITDKESAGEHVLFNQTGGGIALFSTTRIVYSSSNFEMNKSFFKYAFQKDSLGISLRMGDIIRLAKSELGGSVNASKFGLLGDPALQINFPKSEVKILEINNRATEQFTDTINPLSVVSVWGEVQNQKGEKLSGYNGTLYPSVYDKSAVVSTLGNNGQTPFNYTVQNSPLFRGNVTVKQGEFSFAFEVPKEISYRVGNGLIRNYSTDGDSDANGSINSFKLGGSPKALINDSAGPKVKLFLDNEKFKGGDRVSKAPLLLVNLEDESGINTSGSAIGHDITLIIDNNTDQLMVLNDYFLAGTDSYKNGKILFQLPELTNGEHTLTFKVWDLANNSTRVEVRFSVSSGLMIQQVATFPNPFSEYVDFVTTYNRFSEKMTVEIEIFSQQGVKVDQITTESGSSGFSTSPIRWSPGLNNHRLAAGIYYYRLRLTAVDGSTDYATGQLIYAH